MKFKIAVLLLVVAFVLSLLNPAEERLGHVYKLIYIHLPLSMISFASLFFFPVLTYLNRKALNLAMATIVFVSTNLVISAIFMHLAWGGISTSEPRVLFNVFLLFLILFFIISLKISRSIALIYSILQLVLAFWVYQSITASFQLHPSSLVEMDILMKLPLLFTFPAFGIIYYLLTEIKLKFG